jgi:hypothetical protein
MSGPWETLYDTLWPRARHVDLDVQTLGTRGDLRITTKLDSTAEDSVYGAETSFISLTNADAASVSSHHGTIDYPYFVGQIAMIVCRRCHTSGGFVIRTSDDHVLDQRGNNTATFNAAGDTLILIAIDTGYSLEWRVLVNDGVALSKGVDVLVDQSVDTWAMSAGYAVAPSITPKGPTLAGTTTFAASELSPVSAGTQEFTTTVGFEGEVAE